MSSSLAGIGFGLLALLVLFVASVKVAIRAAEGLPIRPPTLAQGAVAFLAGLGIHAGASVCILAATSQNIDALETQRAYIFFGGLAVIWVSIETIWKIAKKMQ